MLLPILSSPVLGAEKADRIKVMSFNVLCSFCNPREYDSWSDRLAYFADIFRRHDPDLIGTQELTNANEAEQIRKLLPNHGVLFYQKGNLAYPDAAIYYRKDRFEVVESGLFWLSPTPEIPMSTGFTGKKLQLARLVIWAVLRDISTGKKLYFASTHYDPNSPSQEKTSPLVLGRMAPIGQQMPVIFVGDFNSRPNSKAYKLLTQGVDGGFHLTDAREIGATKRVATTQASAPDYPAENRIDHIFVGGQGQWTVSEWTVDMTRYGPKNRYPSDHWPIVAEMTVR